MPVIKGLLKVQCDASLVEGVESEKNADDWITVRKLEHDGKTEFTAYAGIRRIPEEAGVEAQYYCPAFVDAFNLLSRKSNLTPKAQAPEPTAKKRNPKDSDKYKWVGIEPNPYCIKGKCLEIVRESGSGLTGEEIYALLDNANVKKSTVSAALTNLKVYHKLLHTKGPLGKYKYYPVER